MANKEKLLDDIARTAGGTASIFSGLGRNIRDDIKARIEELALRMDLVPREDFERLEIQVSALEKRITDLEKPKTNTKAKSKTGK